MSRAVWEDMENKYYEIKWYFVLHIEYEISVGTWSMHLASVSTIA